MTAPTPYALAYDFTSYQAANPTSPLPADKIEIEFNALQTTTDEIITNLGLIQRSDGALANESVGEDQLSAGILAILGAGTGDISTLAALDAEITTLAALDTEISSLYSIRANITTVAGISANVTTVAGIQANVTTVAGMSANVSTVAGVATAVSAVAAIASAVSTVAADGTDIGTVAGNIANVNILAAISTDVTAVADIAADVTTVAGMNTSHISSLAGVAADVAALGPISADITTVAAVDAEITTLAALDTEITALGAISAGLTALAAVDTEITTLAALDTEIAALGSVASHIQTVSVISASVTTVASGMTNVNTVAGIANEIEIAANYRLQIATVAGIAAAVSTVSGIQANVTTVAGISANVTTVAGIAANVTTVAGMNASHLATVAGIATEVSTVAGVSAAVTTVAGISASVTTVAGIDAEIISVASLATPITDIATNISAILNVYVSLSEIGTVSTNIASVNTLAALDTEITTLAAISADITTVAAMTTPLSAAIAGLDIVATVSAASTANVVGTYDNGTAGVGATITYTSTGAETLDGVALDLNVVVLLKDQTSTLENGIYKVTTAGDVGVSCILTRITAFDTAGELLDGSCAQVTGGATSAGMIFILDPVAGGFAMGTDPITFTQLQVGGAGGSAYLDNSSSAPSIPPSVDASSVDCVALGNYSEIDSTGNCAVAIGAAVAGGLGSFSAQNEGGGANWGALATQSVVIGPGYVAAGCDYSVVIGADGYGTIIDTSTGCLIVGRGNSIENASYGCAIFNSRNSQIGSSGSYDGDTDVIIGGSSHRIAGFSASSYGYNAVLGGNSHWLDGVSACVAMGGYGTTWENNPDSSIAMGSTTVDADNMVAFPSIGKGQTSLYIQGLQTTDATPTDLGTGFGNGSPIPITSGDLYVFKILVGASSSSQAAAYEFTGAIKNTGGTTALVGSVTKTVLGEDDAAWDCAVTADDTNDYLAITATGKAATTIKWCASVFLTRVY